MLALVFYSYDYYQFEQTLFVSNSNKKLVKKFEEIKDKYITKHELLTIESIEYLE